MSQKPGGRNITDEVKDANSALDRALGRKNPRASSRYIGPPSSGAVSGTTMAQSGYAGAGYDLGVPPTSRWGGGTEDAWRLQQWDVGDASSHFPLGLEQQALNTPNVATAYNQCDLPSISAQVASTSAIPGQSYEMNYTAPASMTGHDPGYHVLPTLSTSDGYAFQPSLDTRQHPPYSLDNFSPLDRSTRHPDASYQGDPRQAWYPSQPAEPFQNAGLDYGCQDHSAHDLLPFQTQSPGLSRKLWPVSNIPSHDAQGFSTNVLPPELLVTPVSDMVDTNSPLSATTSAIDDLFPEFKTPGSNTASAGCFINTNAGGESTATNGLLLGPAPHPHSATEGWLGDCPGQTGGTQATEESTKPQIGVWPPYSHASASDPLHYPPAPMQDSSNTFAHDHSATGLLQPPDITTLTTQFQGFASPASDPGCISTDDSFEMSPVDQYSPRVNSPLPSPIDRSGDDMACPQELEKFQPVDHAIYRDSGRIMKTLYGGSSSYGPRNGETSRSRSKPRARTSEKPGRPSSLKSSQRYRDDAARALANSDAFAS